jgi:hypothetical protein
MTVTEIIQAYISVKMFDGLVNLDTDDGEPCTCSGSELLMNCNGECPNFCIPAHFIAPAKKCTEDCEYFNSCMFPSVDADYLIAGEGQYTFMPCVGRT